MLDRHDGELPTDDAGWDAARPRGGAAHAARRGGSCPASATPCTRCSDPRTPVLIGIAEEEGLRGPHLRLFEAIGRVHAQVLGRRLPLNGAGVCGAALADLGLPVELLRGFALLARAAGLLGQLAEERRRPIGMDIYLTVDRNAVYVDPRRPDALTHPQPKEHAMADRRRGHRLDAPPLLLPGQHRAPARTGRRSPTSGSPRSRRSARR